MTGSIICSSRPVDILGVQFVPESGFRKGENVILVPPTQFSATSSCGHPKMVLLMSFNCPEATRSCDWRRMGTTPRSANGARATGPTIVIRYSALVTRLKSPPGKTIC
jgi:hypothetical protein